ncbi:MAG: type I methionyl aminopeptidase [Holosporales bacterium]|jgi:methionyl aminopeptidase|nr:type I methionyl aminopeptidase [Holosporales bacterium]
MINIYSREDLQGMRRACLLAKSVLDYIEQYITPGISTGELDELCSEFMTNNGATSATLNYNGFPKSTCISVNHVICHGIPGKYRLKNGDIVNIDITVVIDGWFGDTSRTFQVGKITKQAEKLINVAKTALDKGIEAVKIGGYFREIGYTIQRYVESQGFNIVRDYCGHGIGRSFHEDPQVLHHAVAEFDAIIAPGMFFTIEPMVNEGTHRSKVLSDEWTVVTADKSLSAQFEHTLAVTHDGEVLVLTA